MKNMPRRWFSFHVLAICLGLCSQPARAQLARQSTLPLVDEVGSGEAENVNSTETPSIRIATYNVSLYGKRAGEIRSRLSTPEDPQARKIATIIQLVRPDILLVNELDYEADQGPAKLLAKNYFGVSQPALLGDDSLEPVVYPYLYSAPSNTGIDSAMDLDQDGKLGTGNDSWGYGTYPGQYAMTVYSRFPIDFKAIRTFQEFRWKDLPGAIRPIDPATSKPYYDDAVWEKLRLSSKNHIDVPIRIGDQTLHLLGSHPTPPVFDGPEDRNGARNHDEIQFWTRYVTDTDDRWIRDDEGAIGGIPENEPFVIAGDLNADPIDGSGRREAIQNLMKSESVRQVAPKSTDSSLNDLQRVKTANFGRNGRMRVDYVLPSQSLKITESGVFWPSKSDPSSKLIDASDHRLVWIQAELPSR